MTKDARYIDDFFSFDQILLDAPCSGSGTLNINDSNLKNVFTKQRVHLERILLVEVQQTLLIRNILRNINLQATTLKYLVMETQISQQKIQAHSSQEMNIKEHSLLLLIITTLTQKLQY